jgi:hypothetical protein
MQPRNDLAPRLFMVSQVTKRGYFSLLAALWLLDKALGRENSEDLEDDLEVSVSVARDGVLDEAEGTDEEDAVEGVWSSRLIAAGGGGDSGPSMYSLASPSPAASYCSHSSST